MKKVVSIVIVLVIILTASSGCNSSNIMSCDPNVLYDDPLSQEQKEQISAALLTQYNYDFSWNRVDPCLGTINDCVVLIDRDKSVACVIWGEIIADYLFEWGQPSDLYAYRNGEVCYLREAYEKGWLTKENIRLIYEKHEKIRQNWEQIWQEWDNSLKEAQNN